MNFLNKRRFVWALLLFAGIGVFWFLLEQESTSTSVSSLFAPPTTETSPGFSTPVPTLGSPGKIITDKETGKEYMSNQIIAEFLPGTTEDSARTIIEGVGAHMVAHFTEVPIYLVGTDDTGDGAVTKKVLEKLVLSDTVVKAELNFLTTALAPAIP